VLISAKQGKDILVITNALPDADYHEVVDTLQGWIAENQAGGHPEEPQAQAELPPEESAQPETSEEPKPDEDILQADEMDDEQ